MTAVSSRLRATVTAALALSALATAGSAAATLTATTGSDRTPGNAKIVVTRDDGSGKRVLAAGELSSVSPDNSLVAVTDYKEVNHAWVSPTLRVYATSGGRAKFALRIGCPRVVWSPDSTKLACVAGGRLLLIDAATGARRTLATGFVDWPSFSPDSTSLVFVRRVSNDSARVAGTLTVIDLDTHALRTLRQAATRPVWGPTAIAFSTVVSRPHYDQLDVALIQPDGTGFRRLTHIRPRTYLFGVFPVAWSADGQRLLGGIVGLDAWTARESYAIDPVRGGFRLIAHSVMPSALSRDGRYVIGQTGDPECCGFRFSNIVRVPWSGGKETVLVRHAMVASFNG
jgi:WD40-like Beta Propeller Repeat